MAPAAAAGGTMGVCTLVVACVWLNKLPYSCWEGLVLLGCCRAELGVHMGSCEDARRFIIRD
jgi:hypothetical protein